jgi:hypothetical protein
MLELPHYKGGVADEWVGVLGPWAANFLALLVIYLFLGWIGLALLWRVGAWKVQPADSLTFDEGLRIGVKAPDIAARRGSNEYHLTFEGGFTFLVFGSGACQPCRSLLESAPRHPATGSMRLVYLHDGVQPPDEIDPSLSDRWESYLFDNETHVRDQWRAPVSPYFHVVDGDGRVVEKGVASQPEHLDRLLSLVPESLVSSSLSIRSKVHG